MPSSSELPLDINRQSELALLPTGWHALEVDAGRSFRWVDNDAAFSITAALNHYANVALELEAGPGMGRQSFDLTIHSGTSKQVHRIEDRHALTVQLPLYRQRPSRFTLQANGGGLPCPNDDRQLNFRVFLLATPVDIVTLQSGVELLSGWSAVDSASGEPRRAAHSGARLRVYAPRDCPILTLDIDAGPSPAGLRIDLVDYNGAPVFTTSIRKRQLTCMRLPLFADAAAEFSLFFEWIGRHALPPPVVSAFSLQML